MPSPYPRTLWITTSRSRAANQPGYDLNIGKPAACRDAGGLQYRPQPQRAGVLCHGSYFLKQRGPGGGCASG